MKPAIRIIFTFFSIALIFPGAALAAPAPEMSASLRKSQIEPGESTQLTVVVSGAADASRPLLPQVANLSFTPRGQSTRMQFINGSMSSEVSYIYNVQASAEGTYSIPPIQMRTRGRIIETSPLTLTVSSGSGPSGNSRPSAQPPTAGGQQGLQAFGFNQPAPYDNDNQPAYLRIRIPRDHVYVGELLPVEIRAYFERSLRVTLNSQPGITGGAFTLHSVDKEPRQTEEVMDGRVYSVLTWSSALSAIKEGNMPVTAQLDATLLIRERGRDPFHSLDLFGGDFFDDNDFFGSVFGTTREKSVNMKSPETGITVLPLPEEGRPGDFGGAVGSFALDASVSSRDVSAGDPLTLKVRIKGRGNFDRVSKPVISSEEGFKTYNPEVNFKALDSIGYQGEKFFEQVLIPQSDKITEIPAVHFSYFDPEKKRYVSLSGKPIPLTVRPAPPQPQARSTASSGEPEAAESNQANAGRLAPIHLDSGNAVSSLRPVFESQTFRGLLLASCIGLVIAFLLHRLYRSRAQNPEFAFRVSFEQMMKETYTAIERSISEGNSKEFLFSCRKLAQLKFGRMWGMQPEAITLSDLKQHDMTEFPKTVNIFEMADAVSFSGLTLGITELRDMFESFKKEIERVK